MILRRYTPPTCTLEIKAKNSPLSRWAGQPVLKQLRFELRFDDPRQSEDQQVTIWGDREQLEALHEAVSSYVQDFLEDSDQMPLGMEIPTPGKADVSANGNLETVSVGSVSSFARSGASQEVEKTAEQSYVSQLESEPPLSRSSAPYLQPKGLLTHNLFLGSLGTAESGKFVSLSVLQLFDLATALDQYAADVVALPTLKRSFSLVSPPVWARAAALILVSAGVTTAAIKLLDQSGKIPATVATAPTSPAPPTGTELPPVAVNPVPAPVVPQPPGTNPQVATLPTPTVPQPPSISSSSVPTLQQPNAIPQQRQLQPYPGTLPPPPYPPVGAFNPNIARQQQQPVFVPRTVAPTPYSVQPIQPPQFSRRSSSPAQSSRTQAAPPTPSFSIARLPAPPPLTARPRSQNNNAVRERGSLPRLTPFPVDSLPDRVPQIEANDQTAIVQPQINTAATRRATSEPPLTTASKAPEQESSSTVASQIPTSGEEPSENKTEPVAKGTAFDTIPQVAEVRNYLQQKWQPPEGLTQTLEYYLILNPNGSIDRIVPLGQAAGNFIDKTNIPSPGQTFVSTVDGGRSPKIRVVLSPDGKVQSFLEGME